VPIVVGLWSAAGVAVMVLISLTWPNKATIADTIAANQLRIAAIDAHKPRHAAGEFGSEDTLDLGRPIVPQRRPRPSPTPGARRDRDFSTSRRSLAEVSPDDDTVRVPPLAELEDETVVIESPVAPEARSSADDDSSAANHASAL
jgi:hypothetical protein